MLSFLRYYGQVQEKIKERLIEPLNFNKEINHVSCELNSSVGSLLKDSLLLVPGKLHMDEFEAM